MAAMIRVNQPCTVVIEGGRKLPGVVVGPRERRVVGRRVEFVYPVRLKGAGYTQRFATAIVKAA
ncbi:hypothetical protein [Streptomyces longwoodensis]|uniref:hypothetical protein n=1 Tax=Streptomyces longwoodensis TaxID=68231 RepID=UPI0036F66F45